VTTFQIEIFAEPSSTRAGRTLRCSRDRALDQLASRSIWCDGEIPAYTTTRRPATRRRTPRRGGRRRAGVPAKAVHATLRLGGRRRADAYTEAVYAKRRCSCTSRTAIAPSPTAAATRRADPLRTSPAANTPGRVVCSASSDPTAAPVST
jgi:hypothetical protein